MAEMKSLSVLNPAWMMLARSASGEGSEACVLCAFLLLSLEMDEDFWSLWL